MNSKITASKGKYVVPKNSIVGWVYDIDILLDNKLIAVVGFSEKQTEGAIFWQIEYDSYIWGIENEIKKIAKDYLIVHQVIE
tara:strand:+ start:3652 stop:3897 length:246 start_codon:yes stop_codon:yes gene_type:complete